MGNIDWTSSEKEEVRIKVCKKPEQPYKRVMLMPGETMLDFTKLVQNGSINKNTEIFFIERDPQILKAIKKRLKYWGYQNWKIRFLDFDLTSKKFRTWLSLRPENQKFDFIYLDTCGMLCYPMLQIMADIAKTGICDGRFAVNFCGWQRGKIEVPVKAQEFYGIKLNIGNAKKEKDLPCLINILVDCFGVYSETIAYKNPQAVFRMYTFIWNKLASPDKRNFNSINNFLDLIGKDKKPAKVLKQIDRKEAGRKAAETKKKNKDSELMKLILFLSKKIESLEDEIRRSLKPNAPLVKDKRRMYTTSTIRQVQRLRRQGFSKTRISEITGVKAGSIGYLSARAL